MVFWRGPDGQARCVHDCCCHRGAALSAGALHGEGVACPFHGFVHEGDGRVSLIPANGRASEVPPQYRVEAWPVREAHGFLWLWFGEAREALPPLPFFDSRRQNRPPQGGRSESSRGPADASRGWLCEVVGERGVFQHVDRARGEQGQPQ